jgi:histidinol-phosphate aminotransferase
MTTPTPVPGVLEIEPYVGGRAPAPGAQRVFKLSSNESPLGASPKAIEAFREAASKLAIYPEGSSAVLREAVAEVYGLNPDRIVCGNGSDELLHLIAQCYCRPGDEVMFSQYGFIVYPIAARAASAVPVMVPEDGFTASVDAFIARLTPKTRVVFLANPNNPTGTYLPASEVRRLHAALSPETILVLDAAYAEYVRRNDYESGIELVGGAENVVMTRTLSKVYGLSGLRAGWAYCPTGIADVLNRTRGPFNVNIPAQMAGAVALHDRAFTAEAVEHNAKWLAWLTDEIAALGLEVTPSVGNFVLVHFTRTPGRSAKEADAFLMARGLIVRGVGNYGLPDALRISVGTEEANQLVVAALSDFMRGVV